VDNSIVGGWGEAASRPLAGLSVLCRLKAKGREGASVLCRLKATLRNSCRGRQVRTGQASDWMDYFPMLCIVSWCIFGAVTEI